MTEPPAVAPTTGKPAAAEPAAQTSSTVPSSTVPSSTATSSTASSTEEPASEANLFTLNGNGLFVTLALSGIDGKPQLTYQDSTNAKTFVGDEITLEEGTLGRLASVTTVRNKDAGYTTFTLVLPVVSQTPGSHTVSTIAVSTMHRTSLGSVGHGQLTSYHVTTLNGSARHVQS